MTILKTTAITTLLYLLAHVGFAQETVVRKVSSFDEVELSGAFNIYLKKGDKADITIEANDINQDDIITEMRGNKLYIGMKDQNFNFKDAEKTSIYLTYTQLKKLSNSGAGNITTENPITGDSFKLNISGAGNVTMEVQVNDLTVEMSGTGHVEVTGKAKSQWINMSGAGSYKGFDLISEDTYVAMSGVGIARVYASKRLNANASGVGSIRYKGNPEHIEKSSNGLLGSVKAAD